VTCPVVFDLDGTLVDSAPDIRAAVNRMLEGEGLEPLDLPTVVSFIGHGLPRLVARVMAARGVDESEHARLTQVTKAAYDAAPAVLTLPYPGVPEMLEALAAAGHPLGICTNKPEDSARALLADMGLARWFGSVVGGDRLARPKPDPAMLWASIAELGGGAAVFVGDSEVDAATAHAAGVPFLLFTEGYRHAPVTALNPAATFGDHAGLPALVAEVRAGVLPPVAAGR
jgi:phosphoglycolate phosphatase